MHCARCQCAHPYPNPTHTCTAGDALRTLPARAGLATVPILWYAFWLNCCSCTCATEAPKLHGTELRMQSTSWA
eukprot:scaffold79979_cov18-Tisochrysis_lutea.AAC.5